MRIAGCANWKSAIHLSNPIANQPFLRFLPSYAPTQVYVAGGFTALVPGRMVLLALAWFGGFSLLGLTIFWWKTRARQVQMAPFGGQIPGERSRAAGPPDVENVALL